MYIFSNKNFLILSRKSAVSLNHPTAQVNNSYIVATGKESQFPDYMEHFILATSSSTVY